MIETKSDSDEAVAWSDLRVGSSVWLYEEDARLLRSYREPRNNSVLPAYRDHWQEHTIEDETRVSWIVAGRKIPKRDRPDYPLVLINQREIDETAYVHQRKRDLARTIESLRNHPDNARPLELLVRALTNMGVTVKSHSD